MHLDFVGFREQFATRSTPRHLIYGVFALVHNAINLGQGVGSEGENGLLWARNQTENKVSQHVSAQKHSNTATNVLTAAKFQDPFSPKPYNQSEVGLSQIQTFVMMMM